MNEVGVFLVERALHAGGDLPIHDGEHAAGEAALAYIRTRQPDLLEADPGHASDGHTSSVDFYPDPMSDGVVRRPWKNATRPVRDTPSARSWVGFHEHCVRSVRKMPEDRDEKPGELEQV